MGAGGEISIRDIQLLQSKPYGKIPATALPSSPVTASPLREVVMAAARAESGAPGRLESRPSRSCGINGS